MSSLLEWKKKLQILYSQYSTFIDKGIRFVLALVAFQLISSNIGFMEKLTNPLVSVGLAVVCAFLPPVFTAIMAGILMLVHMFSLSAGVAGITAVILLVMFIFYFRFTPKKALVLLLTPLAFAFKVPVLVPVVYGLIGTPVYAVPAVCGTVVYFLVKYTKAFASTLNAADSSELMTVVTKFAKQVMQSKEMWVAAVAVVLCLVVVYAVRKLAAAHAWEAGAVSGAVVYIVVSVIGNVVFDTEIAYASLIIGSVAGAAVGYILELMVFSADYAGTEHLQFEDDEYYYYVKAVPKLSVASPEKQVKRINRRQETGKIDTKRVTQETREEPGQITQLTGDTDIDRLIEEELLKDLKN